jgi:hypothetical protein
MKGSFELNFYYSIPLFFGLYSSTYFYLFLKPSIFNQNFLFTMKNSLPTLANLSESNIKVLLPTENSLIKGGTYSHGHGKSNKGHGKSRKGYGKSNKGGGYGGGYGGHCKH